MKIDFSNFETRKIFKIKKPETIHTSDFHKLSSTSEIKLVEITNNEESFAGFYLIGEFDLVADMIIHSKYGAQGRVIQRKLKDTILLTKQETIECEMNQISGEEEKEVQEYVRNKMNDMQFNYLNMGLNFEFSIKPKKYSFLLDVDNPGFVLLQKKSKIILANGVELIIRKGDHKVIEFSEENGISVSKPSKVVDIINGNIRINQIPLADFIREKVENKIKFKTNR
ncbi:MAG: hypothetical protein ACTSUV_01950 [Candidatus Ranarchaeia archaeon]